MGNSENKSHGWFYVTSEKIHSKTEARWLKTNKTKNICSIVIILLHYSNNIITIIIKKFRTLLTIITWKEIHVLVINLFQDN